MSIIPFGISGISVNSLQCAKVSYMLFIVVGIIGGSFKLVFSLKVSLNDVTALNSFSFSSFIYCGIVPIIFPSIILSLLYPDVFIVPFIASISFNAYVPSSNNVNSHKSIFTDFPSVPTPIAVFVF